MLKAYKEAYGDNTYIFFSGYDEEPYEPKETIFFKVGDNDIDVRLQFSDQNWLYRISCEVPSVNAPSCFKDVISPPKLTYYPTSKNDPNLPTLKANLIVDKEEDTATLLFDDNGGDNVISKATYPIPTSAIEHHGGDIKEYVRHRTRLSCLMNDDDVLLGIQFFGAKELLHPDDYKGITNFNIQHTFATNIENIDSHISTRRIEEIFYLFNQDNEHGVLVDIEE